MSYARKWCPEPESNQRHEDFQSSALPTELSGHINLKIRINSKFPNSTGRRWIRTTEASCSRFTVCPLWPLGNLPILVSTNVLTRIDYNISFFIVQDKILYFLHFIFQHRSRMWQQRDGDPSIFHFIFFRHERIASLRGDDLSLIHI